MIILLLLLHLALSLLFIPVFVLLIQVLAAIFRKKLVNSESIPKSNITIAVIVPAHNEELGIATTIKSVLPQLSANNIQNKLIVVADNCTDDTAKVAIELGATVVIRDNKQLRGKGYALDFGLQYLKSCPPDVVIVIDADCTISANTINELSDACMYYKRPIQGLDLMKSPSNASLKTTIAEFAWLVKNQVRPLGFKALGLTCQLMGTGMAFLWHDIKEMQLASGHIAEDMKLGIDFCRINKPALFYPNVGVTSYFPSANAAVTSQRSRWEHGHMSVILSDAPSLFLEAIKSKNGQMLSLALDLIVPPLAVLSLLIIALFIATLAVNILIPIKSVLILSCLLFICFAIAILLAWYFFGRHIVSFRQLCYAPVYAVVKIPLYVKFFISRQVEWVRAKRD